MFGVIEITGLRPYLFGALFGVIEITGLTPFGWGLLTGVLWMACVSVGAAGTKTLFCQFWGTPFQLIINIGVNFTF